MSISILDERPAPAPARAAHPVAAPDVDHGPAAPGPNRRRQLLRRLATHRLTGLVVVGLVALVARLAVLPTAYDIFIDETSYASISLSVAHGHGATLYGLPFVLHPPAAFGLWATAILALHLQGGAFGALFALRTVDALVGTVICMLTYATVGRMARRRVALVAGLLIALDPLAISFDSRVMLEAPAQLAMVAMIFFFVKADETRVRSSRRRLLLSSAGLAGGMVLATKETFGLVVGLLLVALLVTGWVVTRREAVKVMSIALVVYVVSIAADAGAFGFRTWWDAKFVGALRLVGAYQNSGFNAPNTHVSFLSRVMANGSVFGVTYVVLVAGTLCALGLLWRHEPWYQKRLARNSQRRATVLVALWTMAAATYLAYATLFGTLEEQMYYILLLPCTISLCLWCAGWKRLRQGWWRTAGVAVLGVAVAFNALAWASIHLSHDDEYRSLVSWEALHVPTSAVIAATDGTSQFVLSRGVIGQWNTVAQLKVHHVGYVILATRLVQQGYGLATPGFEHAVESHGRLVFEANGVSDGSLRVYDVQAITGNPVGSPLGLHR